MTFFGNGIRWTRLAVAGLCSVVVSVAAVRADGTLKLTATSTLVNPCNSEMVTGLVDVNLVVQVNESQDGSHVKVHRSFHGTLTGNQGNSYRISSIANDQLDATASSYVLPFENNVLGQGQAPDFTVAGTLTVFVNANQDPIGYSASATSASCK